MLKGILEGLIQPNINMEIDMSKETSDTHITYNQPVYITIDKLIVADKELGNKIAEILVGHQRPVEIQNDES